MDVKRFNIMGLSVFVKDEQARNDITKEIADREEALQQETDARNVAIASIPANLKGVKCIVIGDSYNRGSGGTIGRGFGYYFQQATGCDALIWQNASGGFISYGGDTSDFQGMNYLQILQQELPKIPEDERGEYKWVIFGGGYNDGIDANYNENALYTQVSQCIATIRNYLPNANILNVPLHNADSFDSDAHILAYQVTNYSFLRNGACCTENSMFWFTGYSSCDAGDSVHLNDEGYRRAGNMIASVVAGYQGGYPTALNGSETGSLSFGSGVSVASGQRFRLFEKDGIVHMFGSLSIADVQASMTLINMPETMRTWGTNVFPAVLQGGSGDYKIIPVAFDNNALRLTADVGGASGAYTLRINTSYPLGM